MVPYFKTGEKLLNVTTSMVLATMGAPDKMFWCAVMTLFYFISYIIVIWLVNSSHITRNICHHFKFEWKKKLNEKKNKEHRILFFSK